MKVEITAVAGDHVTFRCAVGGRTARWVGAPVAPGDARHAELDVDRVALVPGGSGARIDDDAIEGTVERVDPDGIVILRVGPSVLMVEPEGTPPPAGTAVRLVCELTLWEENV